MAQSIEPTESALSRSLFLNEDMILHPTASRLILKELKSLRAEVARLRRELAAARQSYIDASRLANEEVVENRELAAELAAAREALGKADVLFDRTLSASNDASFDQYLHGDAEDVWVSICEAAEQYDEARAAAKGGEVREGGE